MESLSGSMTQEYITRYSTYGALTYYSQLCRVLLKIYSLKLFFPVMYFLYVWVIDQVWGQDGWILAKFFFCVFMDRDEVEVNKLAKKERGQYSAILTAQTWSIQDLLYGFWWNYACGIQRVVPSWQDGSILPARVANHSARFDSSCPLAELAI